MYKSWYQSRTIRLAIAQGIIGILAAIIATDPSAKFAGAIAIVKSFADVYVRYQTDSPIE